MVVIWLCICALITIVSSAPTAEDGEQESGYMNVDGERIDYLRGKRLNNNVYAITPCAAAAAAAAANLQVPRSPEAAYANLVPAEARYYVPSAYDYANSAYGNMYRMEDPYRDAREMLRFSDTNFMEQVPTGRFTYRTAPGTYMPLSGMASSNDQYNAQGAAPGSTYGIFPNANSGTCSVPLLFSCSPSVVRGQMMKPETYVYGGTPLSANPGVVAPPSHPDGYRGVDDHMQRIHANQEQDMYENSAPVNKVITATNSNDKLTR